MYLNMSVLDLDSLIKLMLQDIGCTVASGSFSATFSLYLYIGGKICKANILGELS